MTTDMIFGALALLFLVSLLDLSAVALITATRRSGDLAPTAIDESRRHPVRWFEENWGTD
jgi:hypothetical protein